MSRSRILVVYFLTLILGYAIFIAPNLLFGIFKIGGGLAGLNLAWIGLFQLVGIVLLLYAALRLLGATFAKIGWDGAFPGKELMIGAVAGGAFALVEMFVVIPAIGGAAEPNVARIIEGMGESWHGLLGYLVLGIVGGGIAEEFFNRGFLINVLRSVFENEQLGLFVSATFSVLIFTLGHMPASISDLTLIVTPTLIYTVLFLATKRLTAPIAAHAFHNGIVVSIIWFRYVN